ncbi:MAG: hypothetical protein ACRYGP_07865 [Janthinobacterium lividum]
MAERILNHAERVRLDALRLECLKLAHGRDTGPSFNEAGDLVAVDHFAVAREMFDFVTDAPERLPLWVVRRTNPEDENKSHLSITGDMVDWSFASWAYRFRSQEDALHALDKHAAVLNGNRPFPPPFTVERLPDGYEPF